MEATTTLMKNNISGDSGLKPALNQHITCKICEDYLTDAVTMTGCLHFFCRACLLRRFSSSPVKCCPTCSAKIGPETGFKRDKKLQELVYKLVPDLFWRQLRRVARHRRHQQQHHYHYDPSFNTFQSTAQTSPGTPTANSSKQQERKQQLLQLSMQICSPKEKISIQLDYVPLSIVLLANDTKEIEKVQNKRQEQRKTTSFEAFVDGFLTNTISQKQLENMEVDSTSTCKNKLEVKQQSKQHIFRRFYRCRAGVKIGILKRLLETKLVMTDSYGVYFVDEELRNVLEDDYNLADLIQMYNWSREAPLHLYFTLVQLPQEEDRPPVLEEMPQLDLEVSGGSQMATDDHQPIEMAQSIPEMQQQLWLTKTQVPAVSSTIITEMQVSAGQRQIEEKLQQSVSSDQQQRIKVTRDMETGNLECKVEVAGNSQLQQKQQKNTENSNKKSSKKQQNNTSNASSVDDVQSMLPSSRSPFPPTSSLLAAVVMPSSKNSPSTSNALSSPPPPQLHRLSAAGASPLSSMRSSNYHHQSIPSSPFSDVPFSEQQPLTLASEMISKKRRQSSTTIIENNTTVNNANNKQEPEEKKSKSLANKQQTQQKMLDHRQIEAKSTTTANKIGGNARHEQQHSALTAEEGKLNKNDKNPMESEMNFVKIMNNAIQQSQWKNRARDQNLVNATSTQQQQSVSMPLSALATGTSSLEPKTPPIPPPKKRQRRKKSDDYNNKQQTPQNAIPSTSSLSPPQSSSFSTTFPSLFALPPQFAMTIKQQQEQQQQSASAYATLLQNVFQQQKVNEAATCVAFANMFQLSPQQLQQGMQQMLMGMAAASAQVLPLQQQQSSGLTPMMPAKQINKSNGKNQKKQDVQNGLRSFM